MRDSDRLLRILHEWIAVPDTQVGIEMAILLEEIVARLVTLSEPCDDASLADLPTRVIIHRLATVLFRTLHSVLQWIRLLPLENRSSLQSICV